MGSIAVAVIFVLSMSFVLSIPIPDGETIDEAKYRSICPRDELVKCFYKQIDHLHNSRYQNTKMQGPGQAVAVRRYYKTECSTYKRFFLVYTPAEDQNCEECKRASYMPPRY